MPKFFITSDVHSYCDELIAALDEAGFDPNNENHWLISGGDDMDRGPNPIGVMRFLSNLPRKIIIRGNHTQLFEDLCHRGYPQWHDHSNGTVGTVEALGNYSFDMMFDLCCERALNRTKKYRANMVNYFETKNYIFVHSWIPTKRNNYPYQIFEFDPDWRNADQYKWDDAMWGNPYKMAADGLNQTGKTIVFGHWHCSTGWAQAEGRSEFGDDAKFEPYYGDGFISIDACTAHSGKVNVIVIEDEFLDGGNDE